MPLSYQLHFESLAAALCLYTRCLSELGSASTQSAVPAQPSPSTRSPNSRSHRISDTAQRRKGRREAHVFPECSIFTPDIGSHVVKGPFTSISETMYMRFAVGKYLHLNRHRTIFPSVFSARFSYHYLCRYEYPRHRDRNGPHVPD
jgi:hypothetical protein